MKAWKVALYPENDEFKTRSTFMKNIFQNIKEKHCIQFLVLIGCASISRISYDFFIHHFTWVSLKISLMYIWNKTDILSRTVLSGLLFNKKEILTNK